MEIYIYGAVAAVYIVLAFMSRGYGNRRSFMYAPAAWLWDRISERWQSRAGRPSSVRSSIAILSAPGREQEQEREFYVRRIQAVLCIILIGDLLAAASFVAGGLGAVLREGNVLQRDTVGGEDRTVSLQVKEVQTGEDDSQAESSRNIDVLVRAQKYSQEEIEALADEMVRDLEKVILAENTDADHVNKQLHLMTQSEGYPFTVAWSSSTYALIDSDGTVHPENLSEDNDGKVTLTALVTYDNGTESYYRREVNIAVTVVPAELSPSEKLWKQLQQVLTASDEESAAEGKWVLPSSIGKVSLTWSEKTSQQSVSIALFSMLAAAAVYFIYAAGLREQVRKRNVDLRLEYPGVISKLVLYLGAGMSVRGTLGKLCDEYTDNLERGGGVKIAYEELLLIRNALDSGMSEADAYAMLGMRCHVRQYTRLSSLLLQNLRKGNSELLSALEEEAKTSYEERANIARELGEEAETKLLFPMMLMLAVTMMMIIVPAYYGFTG